MNISHLSFILASLLSASVVLADTPIGNGFTCSGDSILKGGTEGSFSKARSTLLKTLEKLKKRLSTATKKGKAAIKAQIAAANNSKTLIKACTNGELDSSQVDSIFSQLASGSGTYKGNYSGTVGGFLPISGEITTSFTLEQTVFSALLSLGGNLGSTLNAQPLSFSNDVGGISFPAQFFLTGTFLGDETLSITKDGHLTITNSNSPNGTVTYDGQFSSQSISSTVSGSYSGVTFQGSATQARQP